MIKLSCSEISGSNDFAALHKMWENTGFHWPVFSRIRENTGHWKTRILAHFMLFKEKTIFLESEKSFLKVDIAIQQKVIDGIFEYNSNLLNNECCRLSQNTNIRIIKRVTKTKNWN